MKTLSTVLLLFALGGLLPVTAEVLTMPLAAADALQGAPTRGTSMEAVRSQLGEPTEIVPAVGEPPISRWHYPQYTVYFEGQRVLHAAKRRQEK